ncbi:TrbC/VirB2 family protein [Erythrobacter sp. LQ02-29]|uniref:TrbC/VirB2 family protein n=1 Tax=Erythrobacter sp. LQ02-29 TaxID=2920384 RepID=UPI001F4E8604|nr:TrbC/VirB2 family protein [Erythrobacter sp. LQ02-29]MCP9223852.1 TrbC/VirB2 family protein [Erythrobacter sp. LQ02-29]
MNKFVARGVVAALIASFATSPAFAAATGGGLSNVENLLNGLVDLLTGGIARAIAIIALIFCGFLIAFGRGSTMIWSVLIGIVLVFSSAWIVDQIIA